MRKAKRAHDRLAMRLSALFGITTIALGYGAASQGCHVEADPVKKPVPGCKQAADCPCYQCVCETVTTLLTAQVCNTGTCPTGEEACTPVCAAVDSSLSAAHKSDVCPMGGTGAYMGDAGMPPVEECFDPAADAGGCPAAPIDIVKGLEPLLEPEGWMVYAIDRGATTNAMSQCCYIVELGLVVGGGRPYIAGGRSIVGAPTNVANGWCADVSTELRDLSEAERKALTSGWTANGVAEHASVASFARFALSLMAVGAPADLVASAHDAALDEIRHAKACFALASAYADAPVGPGAFPLSSDEEILTDLATLAARTVVEGCVGETLAAMIAEEQHARAKHPAVREALAMIARDEARHAELAWRTVAWAVREGGVDVRDAVARAFDQAMASPPIVASIGKTTPALEAHGLLDAATEAEVVRAGLVGAILPAARALMRSAATTHGVGCASPRSFA